MAVMTRDVTFGAMRVVAGTAGGLRLVAPAGQSTRPTSDRVREATFNSLGSMGVIDGARVLDLFAGSGALGIEALSRGAAHATFVDHDQRARKAVTANLDTTRLADHATVVAGDALGYLATHSGEVDLVLLDPPYEFEHWDDLFAVLPDAVVVVESDRSVEPPAGWAVVRSKRYGTTVVAIFRRSTDLEETST
jgi:16S rRNA (guanine966-N2)-methyltransferase